MTRISYPRRPALGLVAIVSGMLLASCQTSADEVLSMGNVAPADEASAAPAGKKAFRDPYVVAISGQVADASAAAASQNETDPPHLKRKRVPLAAAYTDIAEPPPEVLALQQQAIQGQSAAAPHAPTPANLGELTMQPTTVTPASNSLFSAGQRTQAPTAPGSPGQQVTAANPEVGGSLVPSEMPTLGVNAVRKSLFSPSAEQQMQLQQQALQEQTQTAPTNALPLTESAGVDEQPVLRKLSDPRPKRKILALREPTSGVPEQVQLTPDQLQAMGAVAEADPAEPLPAEELATNAETGSKKKAWLPSLSDLFKGGKKKNQTVAAP